MHFALCSLLLPCPAPAQPHSATEITGVEVGFAGRYKPGLWTPVRVAIRGGSDGVSGRLAVVVPDGEGVPSRVATAEQAPVRIDPGQEMKVVLYVRFGRVESDLTAEFQAEDGATIRRSFSATPGDASFPPAVSSHREIILAIGRDSLGLDEAIALLRERAEERPVLARLGESSQLPDRWYGYEGVDAVVLSGRPDLYTGLTSASPEIAALDEWVQMGGKLLIAAGGEAVVLMRTDAALEPFSPGKINRLVPLRQAGALEVYASAGVPIPRSTAGRFELRVPQFDAIEGSVEAREADLPLVIRRAKGFGQVVFAGLDLDEPPLRGWQGRGLLVRKLLGLSDVPAGEAQEISAIMHHGFDDLAGQLRSSLDQFDEVPLVPYWIVVAAIVGYLLLIGPIDYLFLRNVARRWTLTWVTFPLLVIGVSVGAAVVTRHLKGNLIRVNQVDLVDVDAESGRIRGTTWANVFSPQAERYNVSFRPQQPDLADVHSLTTWLGLPGQGLGGMNPKTATLGAWKQPYDATADGESLLGLPIPIWSTRSLTARWTARAEVPLKAELSDRYQVPVGTITNNLGWPLADARLCYGRWVYDLGTVKPGQSVEIGPLAERRDLKTFLTGRRMIIKEGRELNTPYDRSSTDPAYILRAMLFFERAGGRQYTGLFNRYQEFIDSSDLLDTGRAILIATAPQDQEGGSHQGVQLLRDGEPMSEAAGSRLTVYRFVLPVKVGGNDQ